MTKLQFVQNFGTRADIGDTIECKAGPVRFVAELYSDDCRDAPDKRQDGFWPSLDPNDCGYIGPKSKATLAKHMAHAESIMADWKAGRMFYVGVAVRAYLDETPITEEFESALWGIECNWTPRLKSEGPANSYLRTVANELLPDVALDVARLFACPMAPADWLAMIESANS